MLLLTVFVVLAVLASFSVSADSSLPGSDIQVPEGTSLLRQGLHGSKLYTVSAPNSVYGDAPLLLDLRGKDYYSQGFDAGYLLGQAYVENYNSLLVSLLGDAWWEPAVALVVNKFLDWQWTDYLGVQMSQEYHDELDGMTAGGHAAGVKQQVGVLAARGITLANLPGTLTNFKFILKDEWKNPANGTNMPFSIDEALELLKKLRWHGVTCSMFGVWGSRTEGGRLFSGRNLDWMTDTGVSKYKLVTIYRPPNGYAYATIGWAGIWGAITGMSSQGITVHEANLESDDISYRGFPWVIRLRDVMAKTSNLKDALSLWSTQNNTCGFNFGIGSAVDGESRLLETMYHNTAVFGANDPREEEYLVDGENIGAPRPEAVYRTNHGYDDYTITHFAWNNTGAFKDSIDRYLAFPDVFDTYASEKKAITYVEAVNVTSIIGHKGGAGTKYQCIPPYNKGSNILSVAFDPKNLQFFSAWESGTGDSWTPAGCGTYLKFDMKQWF